MNGVKKGFRHVWAYHGRWDEKKVGPGKWIGTFTATKGKRSRTYGGYGKGTKLLWKITGYQEAVKTNKGEYQTKFRFTKKLVKAKVRRQKK